MEEVDLRALVKLIGRYRGLIGGLVFLCVVASASYTLLAVKREYEARTTLLYADRGSVSSAASGLAGSLGIPLGMSAAGPASWYETILTSRRLARLLVRKHDLVRVLEAKNEGDAIGKLLDRIIVNGKPEANAVMVTVRMPGTPKLYPGRPLDLDRARLAAALANDLVGQLDTWLQTTDYQASSKQRRFVEQQLTRVLGQVNTTREQLLATFRRTGVFAPDDQGQAWLQAMAQLEKDLAAAQTQLAGTEIAQQAGMSSDEVRRLASAAQAAQNAGAVANDVRKQLSELEVQLRREVEVNRKTEDHPDVAQLRGSIKELKGKLNTELAIVNSARTLQEQQLTSQLSMGQARFGELRGRLSALPAPRSRRPTTQAQAGEPDQSR